MHVTRYGRKNNQRETVCDTITNSTFFRQDRKTIFSPPTNNLVARNVTGIIPPSQTKDGIK